jgi:ABC-type glutathione transport system ATPase component
VALGCVAAARFAWGQEFATTRAPAAERASRERHGLIEVENPQRQFRVARKPGRRGRLHRLRRDFADVHAVDGVSFAVEAGEMVGYIGPNGAGKSTTIKMLTGILVPSGGRLSVAGFEPSRSAGSWPGKLAWSSGSAPSSGGTFPSPTPSTC